MRQVLWETDQVQRCSEKVGTDIRTARAGIMHTGRPRTSPPGDAREIRDFRDVPSNSSRRDQAFGTQRATDSQLDVVSSSSPSAQAPESIRGVLANRLAALSAGFRHLGLTPGQTVLIVTCTAHQSDRTVAEYACARVGVIATHIDPTAAILTDALSRRPAVVLACREGSDAVAETGLPCRIFGDRPLMSWWKAFEHAHWPIA
jgi:hypothetical protein